MRNMLPAHSICSSRFNWSLTHCPRQAGKVHESTTFAESKSTTASLLAAVDLVELRCGLAKGFASAIYFKRNAEA